MLKVDQGPSLPSLRVGIDVSMVLRCGWLCETSYHASLDGTIIGAAMLFAMPLRRKAKTACRESERFQRMTIQEINNGRRLSVVFERHGEFLKDFGFPSYHCG